MLPFNTLIYLSVTTLLIFEGAQAINCGSAKSHNATFGQRRHGDRLLYMDTPSHEWKLLRVTEEDVRFPLKNEKPEGKISFINVTDLYTDGNGGCVLITEGGVGKDFVNFHIKSKRNYGYKFIIQVYGLPYE